MAHSTIEYRAQPHSCISVFIAALAAAELSGCAGSSDPRTPAETVGSAETPLAADCRDPSLVRVTTGMVRGHVESAYREFLGIPYAAAPIGALRWKPPMSGLSWAGVRDATVEGNICPQIVYENPPTPSVGGDEDCLVVNVTTPNRPGLANLPVMVWIHGGDFTSGEGNESNPQLLVQKGDVIVVSMNYRLGALGFLAHPALTAESRDDTGNFGLLDQQLALKWVKANIDRFGGDPTNVTIFGDSAGGNSVWDHVVSPRSAGLFQRAITMSGSWSGNWNWLGFEWPVPPFQLADAEASGMQFAEAINCNGSDSSAAVCLRNASVTDLVNTGGGGFGPEFYTWGPVTGGAVVPSPIRQALSEGRFNRVPIMNGVTHDENTIYIELDFWTYMQSPLTADSFAQVLAQRFGADAPSVLAHYPVGAYGIPVYAYGAVDTDLQNSCPTRTFNQLAAAHTAVYTYEFNDPNAPYVGWDQIFMRPVPFPPKAYHGSDVQYVFQSPTNNAGLSTSQFALSDQMIEYWTNFAKFGAPLGHPFWSPYVRSIDAVQSLAPDAVRPVKNFAVDHQCEFWKKLRGI